VWTGKEWLVFGGRDGIAAFADGAAYDPTTDHWRALTPPISMHPGAQAVWTGRMVVVLAKQGGWTYDPAADAWSELPRQDTTGHGVFTSAPVWTGHDVVVVGYGGDLETLAARTLDPETNAWGPVALSPRTGPLGTGTVEGLPAGSAVAGARWDGSRVQVWLQDGSGWAFDPTTRDWARLPSIVGPHDDPETMHAVAGIGSATYELLSSAIGGTTSHQLGRFENGRWSLVGPPQETVTADVDCRLVAADDELVRFCARSGPARIDPVTGAVHPYDDPAVGGGTGRSLAWTGSQLLVFGGRDPAPLGSTGELTAKAIALTP
jgi:hypothetical protein